ncbi:MAG: class I SAM-dependent methyltransferase [Gemmatimonadaceae bacterium]
MPEASALHFTDGDAYERFMGRWSRAVGRVFLEWVAPPSHARCLEVGCGTGVFTEVLLDTCSPAEVFAIDPAPAQIERAVRQPLAHRAQFQIADAEALPFADASFDVVLSALVINFIPDRPRALAEMRRVARTDGIVAGFVWDFLGQRAPSWPLRAGLRKFGADVLDTPGSSDSSLAALRSLFEHSGLQRVDTQTIEATLAYPDFDDFWQAQTPSYLPTTQLIASMPRNDRERLMQLVKEGLPIRPDGVIEYSARAHAIKARLPAV